MVNPFSSPSPSRARLRTSALALALVGSLALAGCGEDEPDTAADPSTSPTNTPSVSVSGSPTPTPTQDPDRSFADVTPVYFTVDTRVGLRLTREPRETGTNGVSAVEALFSGPQDPDYTTSWNPDTKVLGITEADGVITVDLSAQARDAEVKARGARMMAQQLVWTVTELYGSDLGVQLLIDGEPAGEMWGNVDWSEPITRAAADDVRAFVGIDTPAEGATVGTDLTVSGEANAFEATVLWRVLDARGQEQEAGYATAEEGMTLSPYTFTVQLKPGKYTVEVAESDPSDGEGGAPMVETRTITVE